MIQTDRLESTAADLIEPIQRKSPRQGEIISFLPRDYVRIPPVKYNEKGTGYRSVSPKPSNSVNSKNSAPPASYQGVYVDNPALPSIKRGKVDLSKLNKTPKRLAEFQAAGYQRNLAYQQEEGRTYIRGETQHSGRKSPKSKDSDKLNNSLELPKSNHKFKSPSGYNIYSKTTSSGPKLDNAADEEQGSLFSAVLASGKNPIKKLKFVKVNKDERSADQDKHESSRASDRRNDATSSGPSALREQQSRNEKNTSSRDTAGGTISRSESHGSKSHSPGLARQKSRLATSKAAKQELEIINEKLNRKQMLEAEKKLLEKSGKLRIPDGLSGASRVKKITARDLKMPRGHSADPTSRSLQSKDILPKIENKLKNTLGSPMLAQLKPKEIATAAKKESMAGLISTSSQQTAYVSTKQRNIYTSVLDHPSKKSTVVGENSVQTKDLANYQVTFGSEKKRLDALKGISKGQVEAATKKHQNPPKEVVDPSKLRKFTVTDHLLHLFCGYHLTINLPKIPTRFHVGTGNNHEKVFGRFKKRKNLELMNHPGMGNIVWTPLTCKVLRYSTHANFQKYSNLSVLLEPFEEKSRDLPALVQMLIDSKLFSVPDPSLLTNAIGRIFKKEPTYSIPTESLTFGNHIKGIMYISRKYLLAKTIIEYCNTKAAQTDPFEIVPPTFFLTGENFDAEFSALQKNVRDIQIKASGGSVWSVSADYIVPIILKPGEYSNRGKGITIAYNDRDLKSLTNNYFMSSKRREFKLVAQTYLTSPLLFKKRKFDMRCYCLVTKQVDRMIVYWYSQGYARTSSYEYDDKVKDNMMVHLTNEAVQVKGKHTLTPRLSNIRQV